MKEFEPFATIQIDVNPLYGVWIRHQRIPTVYNDTKDFCQFLAQRLFSGLSSLFRLFSESFQVLSDPFQQAIVSILGASITSFIDTDYSKKKKKANCN